MRARCLIGCLLIVLAVGKSANAQDVDPAIESDVIKLLDVLNVTKNSEQIAVIVAQQMIDGVHRTHPDVPEAALAIATDIIRERFAEAFNSPTGLMSRIAPIYVKYFSRDDIAAMIAFYKSDTGRKSVALMPALFQESTLIGQQWAGELMPQIQIEIEKRLRAENLIK